MNYLKLSVFVISLVIFSSVSAQKKNYSVGILLDNRTEKIDSILVKLQQQIKAVVGEDAVVKFSDTNILVNNYNLDTAEQNYQRLLRNDTDIILAFGLANSKILVDRSNYQKPTIYFGAVNREFSNLDIDAKTSNTTNFTYLIESESLLEDIKSFKSLTGFDKLGIAIDEPIINMLPLNEIFDKMFKDLDATYKLMPFNSISDITQNLDNVDAIYLAGGFFLTENEISQLADALIEKQIPSFTNLGTDQVKLGLMATNDSDENTDQFLRRIALTIESYINGTPLADMPVFIESSPRLTLNYNTAELVDVPLKYSLIGKTSFVGEAQNVLSKKSYTLIEAIDDVLEQNLSLKSQNKDIDLTEQDVKTAKSNYLPLVTASSSGIYVDPDAAEVSFGQNPEFSTSGNVTLQQTLFSEAANANIAIQKKLNKAQ